MDTMTESGRKTRANKKKVRTPKVKRKFAVRDVRVGSMLMVVLAVFALLIAAVGGMAAFFLNSLAVPLEHGARRFPPGIVQARVPGDGPEATA